LNYKSAIKIGLSFLLLFAISFFFYREFQKNWLYIHSFDFNINVIYISMAFLAVAITYIINTYCWFYTVNSMSKCKIRFVDSFAVFNTCYLTKYIPGKVWSLAIQMYCLKKYGLSKSLVLYINIITLYISIVASLTLGISYLFFTSSVIPLSVTVPSLIILIISQIIFIKYGSIVFNRLLIYLNKLLKLDIQYFEAPLKLFIHLHIVYLFASLTFGMAAYLLCSGIGFQVPDGNKFSVMSSMLISEVVGVLAIIVPSGLGIREGAMYLQLKSHLPDTISLILPLASRLVNMLVDISFGTIGLILFNTLRKNSDLDKNGIVDYSP